MAPQRVVVLHRWQVATAFLGVTLAFVVAVLDVQLLGASGRRDLCVKIHQLNRATAPEKEASLKETRRYLRQHPHGTPVFPVGLIRRSRDRLASTVRLLHAADCTPGPKGLLERLRDALP